MRKIPLEQLKMVLEYLVLTSRILLHWKRLLSYDRGEHSLNRHFWFVDKQYFSQSDTHRTCAFHHVLLASCPKHDCQRMYALGKICRAWDLLWRNLRYLWYNAMHYDAINKINCLCCIASYQIWPFGARKLDPHWSRSNSWYLVELESDDQHQGSILWFVEAFQTWILSKDIWKSVVPIWVLLCLGNS